ncbi:helix-turn-helix domain-containing protein [Sphingobacterium composti Ten et al. 2007 non Yoo et al. 2007]|uniref:helix-turn-helix domain-containing protein n=1 Tax=Sphingobacterium composti TaxID=363260 RepID=UPI00135B40A0|nr:helix-turn-helix domain-containing protein [Sphingobacterium composti Ten et al. 2007 non Yoo et al. 2007]
MPINFFQNIKSCFTYDSVKEQDTLLQGVKNEHVEGVYIFTCKNLISKQSLFNDGLPSVILMPNKTDKVLLKEEKDDIILNSVWLCYGVIKNIYWQIPEEIDYILVIRFKPASFNSIFNISPSVFSSKPICNLTEVVNEKWQQVFNDMYEKELLLDRLSFLDNILSSYKVESNFPFILNIATQYIEDRKGNTTIVDVLFQLGKGVNSRWLHRNFVKYIGISPKKYISLQRFIYSYNRLKTNKVKDFSDVPLITGYYDYNHFSKDFKHYIGTTPTQYSWE